MRNLKTLLTLVFAIAGAALAVPAIASAETFCINAGGACPVGGNDFGDLQSAMNAAQTQDGNDEILLGDKQTPYFGPFSYEPASRGANNLAIRGVGGRPSLTAPVGDTVLDFSGGSLENLAIVTDFGEGQAAKVNNAQVKDVKVLGPDFVAPDLSGLAAVGSTLEDVEISGGYEPAFVAGVGSVGGEEVVARRMLIHGGPSFGVFVGNFSSLELTDSRISARSSGVSSAGFAQIRRSVVQTSAPDSIGLNQFNSFGPYELDHVTVAHTGKPSGTDSAIVLRAETPLDTRLHAVALAGYTRGFRRINLNGSPENVVISDSVWDPANDDLGGNGVFVESRNAHVTPEVVDLAGGDLHPRAGSAAIDRDVLTDITQFADLEGVPALDGDGDGIVRPDAGAFEFRPSAPPPAGGGDGGGAGGGSAGGGTPSADLTAPVLKKLRLTTGRVTVARAARVSLTRARKLKLAFTASEASTVRIVPRRVVGGRAAKPRRAIVRGVAAGPGSIALGTALRRAGLLRPGELRLVVTAKDAAANRSAKRVVTLRLKA